MLLDYAFQVLGLKVGATMPNAYIIFTGQFIGTECQQGISFLVLHLKSPYQERNESTDMTQPLRDSETKQVTLFSVVWEAHILSIDVSCYKCTKPTSSNTVVY